MVCNLKDHQQTAHKVKQRMKTTLVFGGNGFIGAEAVQQIAQDCQADMQIVLVNRGKTWDWDKIKQLKPIVDRIIKCDRKKPLSECEELVRFVDETRRFEVVIDFSGYKAFAVQESLSLLGAKTGLYVYISSDSVYEVCDKKHAGLTRETDATRPSSEATSRDLIAADQYGHHKLAGEETLLEYRQDNGEVPDYIFLRLADVVGARDSTGRWWQYQLWARLCLEHKLPMFLPEHLRNKPISLVSVNDIAKLISKLVAMDAREIKSISNNAYNLACGESPTVQDILKTAVSKMQSSEKNLVIEYTGTSYGDVPLVYPSVEKGPVDISKARALLAWEPTPLDQVLERTVNFYDEVMASGEFETEKEDVSQELIKDISDLYRHYDGDIGRNICKILGIQGSG